MDKNKLIRIIGKDLEELKFLTEEIAEAQNSSQLIVDLALSKARLLCQEIVLLRECLGLSTTAPDECTKEEPGNDTNSPNSALSEQEEQKISEKKELVFGYGKDEPEMDEEPSNDEDLSAEAEENEIPIKEDNEEDTSGEALIEFEDQSNVHKPENESTVRKIHVEDLDDENDHIGFTPQSGSTARKVMHEIPKPEQPAQASAPISETPQKERSLNETIGETKPTETSLGNGPIASLKTAIGLNDRFLFIREIFGNNTDKYNMIIDHLDKLETIQQAVDYLKINLSLQKNETSMKFVDLLKRRFSKQ